MSRLLEALSFLLPGLDMAEAATVRDAQRRLRSGGWNVAFEQEAHGASAWLRHSVDDATEAVVMVKMKSPVVVNCEVRTLEWSTEFARAIHSGFLHFLSVLSPGVVNLAKADYGRLNGRYPPMAKFRLQPQSSSRPILTPTYATLVPGEHAGEFDRFGARRLATCETALGPTFVMCPHLDPWMMDDDQWFRWFDLISRTMIPLDMAAAHREPPWPNGVAEA
ncbi:MAG: hypothetical protein KDB06_01880 [Ilumatobacter sp.]|nr:hypothetical protein [Ilumatobacter sp.]